MMEFSDCEHVVPPSIAICFDKFHLGSIAICGLLRKVAMQKRPERLTLLDLVVVKIVSRDQIGKYG